MGTREVLCDHKTAGGGWTVIVARRKVPRHISFNRTWHEYEEGFGEPTREFWIGKKWFFYQLFFLTPNIPSSGLKTLNALTREHAHQLRADMEDWEESQAWAAYNYFT